MQEFFILSGITLASMASPGPDMFLIIRNGLCHGKRGGFLTVLGICAGLSVHLALALFGLSWLITQNSYIYSAVRYLGAAYLVYLGVQAMRSKGTVNAESNLNDKPAACRGFREGFFTNLLNPKVTIFIFAVFTQFIDQTDPILTRLAFGVTILLTAFLGWMSFVLILQTGPVRDSINRLGVYLDRIFGGIMVAIGLRVALIRD